MTSDAPVTEQDRAFMRRALFLAERGRGTTSPNPVVGAVLVSRDGVVVGQGAHRFAGGPHAEILALEAAGEAARGATLYCTLEPCSHRGRTGPCVEQIVSAGVGRVVVAAGDPNPRVNGSGVAFLRARGVAVLERVEEAAAVAGNAPFLTWMAARRPFVTLKVAISRDGFAGRADGPAKLTSAAMDRRMHRQRAEVDAIAVGSETVLVDDPQLTARLVYRARPLTRAIFDRRGRVTDTARVFRTLDAGPVIIMKDGIAPALEMLAARDVLSVLVEGGPTLHRAFHDAGEVDRVQVIETAVTLGGGVPAFRPKPPGDEEVRVERHGPDVLKEWDVHRPH